MTGLNSIRRMALRWLLYAITAFACLAHAGSYFYWDAFSFCRRGHCFGLSSAHGSLVMTYCGRFVESPAAQFQHVLISEMPASLRNHRPIDSFRTHRFGFGCENRHVTGKRYAPGAVQARAIIPHWVPTMTLLLSSGVPMWRLWRKRLRLRNGLCIQCGYDLKASPTCCPECGSARKDKGTDKGDG
jgi:hypothetical protein